jgi:GTP-binding protein Era
MSADHHFGAVALVGRPNVGKSTLLNRLIGQRLSIVTRKPQTTRQRLLGILTRDDGQMLLVDTPGIHGGARRAINRYMNRTAVGALDGVQAAVWVVDATHWREEDDRVLAALERFREPVFVALNKVDRVKQREKLLPEIERLNKLREFEAIVPVCALDGDGVDELADEVMRSLPLGEPVYDEDDFTDASMRFLAAELVREQLIMRLHQELPYRLAVSIEAFDDKPGRIVIGAVIWVESKSQKGMVIGKNGEVLKAVGTRARHAMEDLFGRSVHLDLWVKVREGWSDDEQALRQMGYGDAE